MESDKGTLWPFKTRVFLGHTGFAWCILGSVFIFLLQSCSFVTLRDRLPFERSKVSSGILFHVTETISMCDPSTCFLSQYAILTEQNQKYSWKMAMKIQAGKQQGKLILYFQFPWNFWLPPFPLLRDWILLQQNRLLLSDEGVVIDHKCYDRKGKGGT